MEEIKITSKLESKELFHFLMYHSYSSVWGFAGLVISVCAWVFFIRLCLLGGTAFGLACTAFTGSVFTILQPLKLYLQSQRIMTLDEGYKKPITFLFQANGLTLQQETDRAFYGWHQIKKIISTGKIVAIYADNHKVFKIARRDMVSDYEQWKEFIKVFAKGTVLKLK